jgi:hypothetical protein
MPFEARDTAAERELVAVLLLHLEVTSILSSAFWLGWSRGPFHRLEVAELIDALDRCLRASVLKMSPSFM